MNVREIMKYKPAQHIGDSLIENGFDGLYDPNSKCCCDFKNFLSCEEGSNFLQCKPGYKRYYNSGDNYLIVEKKNLDKIIKPVITCGSGKW